MSALVIVESPAKAKTISRVLGRGYVVEASYGHIRDLPANADEIPARVKKEAWARLGVNLEKDFEPIYVVPADKKKYVQRLKKALAGADALLLATDEDREGESISWHVVEVLKPKVPVQRIAFHEITAEAIREAVESPRDIDESLVKAQESRRILDRLFGYMLSPVLWKKVRRGLSAGRVQSVAVRLAVLRERERRKFHVATYWDADAEFLENGRSFTARLVRVGERRVANGQDFSAKTGLLRTGSDALWLDGEPAVRGLLDRAARPFRVAAVEQKPQTRRPAPPFTTSTLQQEANRKLRFSAQRTMRIAQRLYEGIDLDDDRVGLITYMRTDSVTLAERALKDAQQVVTGLYGSDYTDGPRRYRTKSVNAQEAHEAIRPTEISRTPESVARHLDRDAQKLYELIWKRTIASQMVDARLLRTAVEIESTLEGPGDPAGPAVFAASGKTIVFPGFLRAYVEGSDDPDAEIADQEVILPPLEQGQALTPVRVEALPHETAPPARYTEASLVKKLEAEGIGRPSTYASIVDTIQDRGYIVKRSNSLVPTFTAMVVTQLLEQHFGEYVDIKFTARMEDELDEIANGRMDPLAQLNRMYHGNGDGQPGLARKIASEEAAIEYPMFELGEHPESGQPVVVKVGRYGPYVQVGENDDRVMASIPNDIAPADLTVNDAIGLLERKQQGPRELGHDPETGLPVYVAHGRYGAYVQLGETPTDKKAPKPKRSSLPKGMHEDEATLKLALKLLSLPRSVGKHPETGEEIVATKGRFGPYIKCGKESRSLDDEQQIFTIDVEAAVAKLKQPKRRGRSRTRTVLREVGQNAEGAPVQLMDGPYGAYLTDGSLNASLPKSADPNALTLDEALRILADKGKPPRRRGARTARGTTVRAAAKRAGKKKTKRKAAKKKSKQKAARKKPPTP